MADMSNILNKQIVSVPSLYFIVSWDVSTTFASIFITTFENTNAGNEKKQERYLHDIYPAAAGYFLIKMY